MQHLDFHLGNQAPTRQLWVPSSSSYSPPRYLPPTPTREIQDLCAMSPHKYSAMEPKNQKPCDISNLMSPPEAAPLDSYTPAGTSSGKGDSGEGKFLHQPLSPPVSPFSRAASTISPATTPSSGGKDPILYPAAETAASAPTGPLFTLTPASAEIFKTTTERLVNEHIASRPADLFRDSTPPKPEDYELALYFKSNCFRMFQDNPQQWLRRERELLEADRKHRAHPSRPIKLAHILPASKPAALGPQTAKAPSTRVQKPNAPKVRAQNPRPIRATPAPAPEAIHAGSPEPRVRTVAPNREDKDFAALEDLSPPLSSLPPKGNSLKVDWKGNALDLSNDPHRHLLHPDELILASNLRLDCATYLTSKRRIFLRRLECARIGKEFRKTDAQQACKIDVNKASKLWQAYEKVGWLKIEWMQEHLDRQI
ncbi:SWIRM domain-containing protein FUN19 [Achaetomium macrosporum]|uniref:SWIRM domain-containing protein FUN19 n=1 Tax=Achaetomium macrosporum TaxID=79813 RepID=A0AAN7HFL8_9PEZI|nr:SWIRM domain-containing protein FUN19 [Achaetomium macrosporum]